MKKKNKTLKRVLIAIAAVLGTIVVAFLGYFLYVLIAFYRLPDETVLKAENASEETVSVNEQHSILSFNIGFGAYEDDYSFFMDGGHESWAWSKDRLDKNLKAIASFVKEENADFVLLQEVDIDGTRTYHVDESKYFTEALQETYGHTFAQNYDSPFLMYPFYQPHGANKAGIMTFSKAAIREAVRYSLPIEESLYKLLDLDRCYMVDRIPTEDGKELVLLNFHLSAYTSDGKIADEQVKLISEFMQNEYEKGNYVIAGGDFNKDLTGDATNDFGTLPLEDYTWAQPFPSKYLEGKNLTLVVPYDPETKIASCRNPDAPWTGDPATQFVITIDGFLVSDNVEVRESEVCDLNFKYSDHNPVRMVFTLKTSEE